MSMYKTYTEGSRHNVPRDDVANLGVRVSQLTRRKIEVAAKLAGKTKTKYCVDLLEDAVCGIMLSPKDYDLIDKRIADQRCRNRAKISGESHFNSEDKDVSKIMKVFREA